MNLIRKLKFLWVRPTVIAVTGFGQQAAKEAILQVLKGRFKIGEEILIFATDLRESSEIERFEFLMKQSSLPILIVTHLSNPPLERTSWTSDEIRTKQIKKIIKFLSVKGFLILNFDDKTVRELRTETQVRPLTLGFQEGADFQASDLNVRTGAGVNFKINYKGNIVPVWLKQFLGKEQIYAALTATCLGTILGLNLIEISQALKEED